MLLNVATVQMDVQIRKPAENTQKVLGLFENAVAGGANLVVFPECAITGYGYGSRAEAEGGGIWIDGPELTKLIDACHKLNSYMVVGFAENAPDGLFNTAALIGPNGMIGCFRKCHLPFIGMDRYADRGGGLPVFDTPIGKFGILICYDIRFPEAARTMALEGIDVLIIPTNWPEQSEGNSDYICPARARENWIYVAAANRVGHESGFDFIGKSGIWDVSGRPISLADHRQEATLTAQLDLDRARNKHVVIRPGEFESRIFEDRRPDLYHVGQVHAATADRTV